MFIGRQINAHALYLQTDQARDRPADTSRNGRPGCGTSQVSDREGGAISISTVGSTSERRPTARQPAARSRWYLLDDFADHLHLRLLVFCPCARVCKKYCDSAFRVQPRSIDQ